MSRELLNSLLDCIGHVYDALLDMVADENYQLQTEVNNACLKTARAMLIELKSPSLDETNVFCRLADRNTREYRGQIVHTSYIISK